MNFMGVPMEGSLVALQSINPLSRSLAKIFNYNFMKHFKYLLLMLVAVLALLVSCGNSKSSPEAIEGYEFTGDGIFGNLPYAVARCDYEANKLNEDLKSKGIRLHHGKEGAKYAQEFNEEYYSTFENLAQELDGKEIPFERHVGDKEEELKGFKLKLKDIDRAKYGSFQFDIEKPEGYAVGMSEHLEGRSANKILPLDKDDKAIDLNGVRWLQYGVSVGRYVHRLDVESNMREMLRDKQLLDQVVKLVEVDDAALEKYAKDKQEADNKEMEEAAKSNDLSKADFTEKGCGPIALGKKVKSLPDKYENLYTSYKWRVDKDENAKVYTFFNGAEEVVSLYANMKNGEIFRIFVKSDQITVKFDGGKTLKPGMKLIDAVKAFGEECQASWTPEAGATIHFGIYGIYSIEPETASDKGIEMLREIADSFDRMPMQPDYVLPEKVMDTVTLSLYDMP